MKKDRKRVKVYINDIEVSVLENSTVLQACEKIGVKVPRFCYHEKLSIAGNCRMCLVEVKNAPKLQASCALPVMADARIYTDTLAVRKAREGIMELLLINHPLDCPICDQGGECDLQDQAMYYGSDHGRFNEYKRATSNKNFGPLIKTIMNRCIHCTRCVRFATEIAGCPEVGTIGRGSNMEITTFNLNPIGVTQIDSIPQDFEADYSKELAGVLDSELSGNLIDICPVGALTSLPYAFVARPWECKSIASIDVSDTYCSKVKLDLRGQGPGSILRVLPNDGSWISDKTRFSYDGLKRQRLVTPLLKASVDSGSSQYSPVTWEDINSSVLPSNLNKGSTTIFIGNHVDYPSMKTLAELKAKNKNLNLIFINSDAGRYNSNQTSNLHSLVDLTKNCVPLDLNTLDGRFLKASDLDEADFCLLIGTNPRLESPVLNTALQKIAKRGSLALIGSHATTLPYPVTHLGMSMNSLTSLLSQLDIATSKGVPKTKEGEIKGSKAKLIKAKNFAEIINSQKLSSKFLNNFKQSKRKLIIIGSSVLYRPDRTKLLDSLSAFVAKQSASVIPSVSEAGQDNSSPISLHFLYQSVSELNAYKAKLDLAQLNAEGYANLLELSKSNLKSTFIYYNLPTYALNHPVIKFSLELKSQGKDVFRVYIGSHGNRLTGLCDLILPVTTYTEKEAIYYNTFGEENLSSIVTYPPGHAVADSLLFNKLKESLI